MGEDIPLDPSHVQPPQTLNAEVPEPSDQYVTDTQVDFDKAWDMAHAGKENRDHAADSQAQSKHTYEAMLHVGEDAAELREPVKLMGDMEEKWSGDRKSRTIKDESTYYKTAQQVDRLIDSKDPVVREALRVVVDQLKKGGAFKDDDFWFKDNLKWAEDEIASKSHALGFEAIDSVRKAEKVERWAEVLHDLPPSDAYKERFGLNEEITPKLLAELEDELAISQATVGEEDGQQVVVNKLKQTFIEDIRTGRANMWE